MKMKFKRDKDISIEDANGRTHGECLYAEILRIKKIDDLFVSTLYIYNKPKRLPRELALQYYTKKLRTNWDQII